MNTRAIGIEGESVAEKFLKEKGYEILTTNFTSKVGEIDIIAFRNDTYIFVEVKNRNFYGYGRGLESVTPLKIHRIIKTAEIYLLSKQKYGEPMRFDVILVEKDCVSEHIKNAFTKADAGRKNHW